MCRFVSFLRLPLDAIITLRRKNDKKGFFFAVFFFSRLEKRPLPPGKKKNLDRRPLIPFGTICCNWSTWSLDHHETSAFPSSAMAQIPDVMVLASVLEQFAAILPGFGLIIACAFLIKATKTIRNRLRNRIRNRGYAVNEMQNMSERDFSRMFRMSRYDHDCEKLTTLYISSNPSLLMLHITLWPLISIHLHDLRWVDCISIILVGIGGTNTLLKSGKPLAIFFSHCL